MIHLPRFSIGVSLMAVILAIQMTVLLWLLRSPLLNLPYPKWPLIIWQNAVKMPEKTAPLTCAWLIYLIIKRKDLALIMFLMIRSLTVQS